jgi:hypothetical protein
MSLKDRYQSEKWKEYHRTYHRSWHQRNREKRLARMYERKAAIYQHVQNVKRQLCCVDCGQRHPATLQFHHLNSENKVFNISDAARRGTSLDRIQKEMQKCIVLCANCHLIRHYNMRKKNQSSPGVAGELEQLYVLLAVSPEEEEVYNMLFGDSGDV